MTGPITYELVGDVALIGMDDGKVNALSGAVVQGLERALDRAENDRAVVVLEGRDGVFSAGFDLATMQAGGEDAAALVLAGTRLTHRMLSFPQPIVVACTGHAMAMGFFLLLCADLRIGAAGADHKIMANEVAIGIVMPWTPLEVARLRLAPSHFQRSLNLSERYTPDSAVGAGILDHVVAADELRQTARDRAAEMTALDLSAHASTKLRTREAPLNAVLRAVERDEAELRGGFAT